MPENKAWLTAQGYTANQKNPTSCSVMKMHASWYTVFQYLALRAALVISELRRNCQASTCSYGGYDVGQEPAGDAAEREGNCFGGGGRAASYPQPQRAPGRGEGARASRVRPSAMLVPLSGFCALPRPKACYSELCTRFMLGRYS